MKCRCQGIVHKTIIGEGDSPGLGAARHDSAPYRVDCQTETQHFEGVALLPSRGALDVMHRAFVIYIQKSARALVQGFEVLEEHMHGSKMRQLVAYLHLPVIVSARSLTSKCVEGRVPVCFVESIP